MTKKQLEKELNKAKLSLQLMVFTVEELSELARARGIAIWQAKYRAKKRFDAYRKLLREREEINE